MEGAGHAMLRSQPSGQLLAHTQDRGLHLTNRGDDSAMWRPRADGGFTAATTGATIEGERFGAADALEPSYRLTGLGDGLPAHFEIAWGPTRLPTAHLAEFRETGFTIVPGFSPAVCAAMREAVYDSSLETVANLGGPAVVAPARPRQEGGEGEELRLSVPRSRRGSTGGEGIQVFRDGFVVQGERQPATIPFDSISDATVHAEPEPCVRIWQLGGGVPFAFGTADLPTAESLSARIMEAARPEDEPRQVAMGGGGKVI